MKLQTVIFFIPYLLQASQYPSLALVNCSNSNTSDLPGTASLYYSLLPPDMLREVQDQQPQKQEKKVDMPSTDSGGGGGKKGDEKEFEVPEVEGAENCLCCKECGGCFKNCGTCCCNTFKCVTGAIGTCCTWSVALASRACRGLAGLCG